MKRTKEQRKMYKSVYEKCRIYAYTELKNRHKKEYKKILNNLLNKEFREYALKYLIEKKDINKLKGGS